MAYTALPVVFPLVKRIIKDNEIKSSDCINIASIRSNLYTLSSKMLHKFVFRINQASVDIFEFTIYNNQQYPETVRLPYPKPSRPIPETSITIIDVATLNLTPLTPVNIYVII